MGWRGHLRRERFYALLARCQASGLPLPRSLRASNPGVAEISLIAQRVQSGERLSEALRAWPSLPEVERQVVEAGETSGRLDEALRALSGDLERQRLHRSEMLRQIAYPALVLHLVPPAISTGLLVTDPGGFVTRLVICYVALWSALLIAWLVHRRLTDSARYRMTLRRTPILGPVVSAAEQLGVIRVLHWLYAAGVPFQKALATAVDAQPQLPPDWQRAVGLARDGRAMSECFEALRSLDDLLRSELVTGAEIGDLEATLGKGIDELEQRVRVGFRRLARATGSTIYALAVIAVAAAVVHFYSGYFDSLLLPR